jgi:hypothetical protein
MRRNNELSGNQFDELKADLTAISEAISRLSDREEAGSFSLSEFCRRHRFSEAQYHKLKRAGRGPRTMVTGDAGVRISREAEADWILERERDAKANPKPPRSKTASPAEAA